MDRQHKLGLLILCGLCAAGTVCAPAQDPPPEPPSAREMDQADAQPDGPFQKKPRSRDEIRRRIEQLPAEQRERFRKNLERWQNLTPEQRDRMRDRQERRFGEMLKEAQEAADASGLKLDEQQRARFIRRYMHERQQIEETIRKECDEKRQAMIAALLERMKKDAATAADGDE